MKKDRTLLEDVTVTYGQFRDRYNQAMGRGDYDRADDAMSVMQTIERCCPVHEVSKEWRTMVEEIRRREAA